MIILLFYKQFFMSVTIQKMIVQQSKGFCCFRYFYIKIVFFLLSLLWQIYTLIIWAILPSIILLQFTPLSERKGFIVLQNFFVINFNHAEFWKNLHFSVTKRICTEIHLFLSFFQFKSVLFFKYKSFILDGNMIALHKVLFLKDVLFVHDK